MSKKNKTRVPTVEEIRQSGKFIISVHHSRLVESAKEAGNIDDAVYEQAFLPVRAAKGICKDDPNSSVSPRGGVTVVTVKNKQTGEDFSVTARCSHMDNFNYKRGVQICLGRLAKQGVFA